MIDSRSVRELQNKIEGNHVERCPGAVALGLLPRLGR